ncbi:acyl-CoA N-acyltransferase [Fusarium tricinctum]|uniref:Acyl-CoA N-acyltransferase n=2 Tax=Fusarium tricinctum species complex TaxID=679429 RepID=A0A8K0WE73_9HYPO|nr:acyl-CoA N-acyltransferase [Fusarium tricinctum]
MSLLTFRPATPTDAPQLLSHIVSAYRGPSSRAGWTTEADLLADERISIESLIAKITDPAGVVLLAFASSPSSTGTSTPESESDSVRDSGLVACCEVLEKTDDRAYFGLFAVSPKLQAGGIGRQVLQYAENYAKREWGTKTMTMQVIWTRAELIAWYMRRGYVRTGEKSPFPYAELVNGKALRDDLYFEHFEKELA